MGLSTSLLELNKREEKEVKLRKISKTKRLSSEQIADLFNVTAGVYIIYHIVIFTSNRLQRRSWWETRLFNKQTSSTPDREKLASDRASVFVSPAIFPQLETSLGFLSCGSKENDKVFVVKLLFYR